MQSKKGREVTRYIYGTGLILQVTGGEYATYHYDNRGSTVAITNSNGKVTFTSLDGGKGVVSSEYLKSTTLGFRGVGVYAGTTPTPTWGVKHIPVYGWGLADTTVRIPIKITSDIPIDYVSWPMYTSVIRTKGENLSLK